jgi:hypothetical protein
MACQNKGRAGPQRMMIVALLLFFVPQNTGSLKSPGFIAEPPEISAGSSAELRWEWPQASRGYLTGAGSLESPPKGTLNVAPRETTDYILILETPDQSTKILSQRIVVRGAKGSVSDYPPDPFDGVPKSFDTSGTLTDVAVRIRTLLERGFNVRDSTHHEKAVFTTSWAQRPSVNNLNERPRKIRQIAYRVELTRVAKGKVHVDLAAIIQWRLTIDRNWYEEKSSSTTIYQTELERLTNEILNK